MLKDKRSIIIILAYVALNGIILLHSLTRKTEESVAAQASKSLAPEFTEIEKLEYFQLKNARPLLSLSATEMRSRGEELAEFVFPVGVYNYQEKNKTLRYQAATGVYRKEKNTLLLEGGVKLTTDEAQYAADRLRYFFNKDLITGTGNIRFDGDDLKTRDHLTVTAAQMKASPRKQQTRFQGGVKGKLTRRRQYEGNMTFASDTLIFQGDKSLAQLEGNVALNRGTYDLTAGKADIHLENYNKALKYFVMNDDVKMREKLRSPQGEMMERRAFAERLEGFGREQKMVLSGAPRVEQGEDVIKGYRITIRENAEFIEVDDAMSDVQVKRKKLKE